MLDATSEFVKDEKISEDPLISKKHARVRTEHERLKISISDLQNRLEDYTKYSKKVDDAAKKERTEFFSVAAGLVALNAVATQMQINKLPEAILDEGLAKIATVGLHVAITLGSLTFYMKIRKKWKERREKLKINER